MTLRYASIASGTLAERPAAAAVPGLVYLDLATGLFSKSDGASWTSAGGAGTGDLLAANNLSDVADIPTARNNLQVSQSVACGGKTIPITTTIGATGLLNISGIVANVCSNADFTGTIKEYTIPALVDYQLVANTYYYITVIYNGGTPIYDVITDNTIINHADRIAVCQAFWENVGAINEGHVFCVGDYGLGLANKIGHRLIHTERFGWEAGLALSESGTRYINLSAGTIWYDGEELLLSAVDTGGDAYHLYYHSAPNVWTAVTRNSYSNTEYDNNTGGLQTLSAGKYAVNWVYRDVNSSSTDTFVVLGTDDYSLNQAQAAQPPASLPAVISKQCVLTGRIIVASGASTATQIDSAFAVAFSPSGIIVHNDVTGRDAAAQHPASSVVNTPAGTISSTTVQAAINELDTDVVARQPFHGIVARPVGAGNPIPINITTTTFTLGTLANPLSYYYQGTLVNVTTDKTTTLAGAAGLYHIYFDQATGNLLNSTVFPGVGLTSNVYVASVKWNGSNYGLVNDERHGYSRNPSWHIWAHTTVGTRYYTGITLTHNSGTGAAATFSSTSGQIDDEDIQFVFNASSSFPTPNAGRLLYQTGAATYGFVNATSTVPGYLGPNNRPYVVNSTGYVLTELSSAVNRFINVWVYGTTDLHTPLYFVTETASAATVAAGGYTSTANARAVPFPSFIGSDVTVELRPLYRLVWRADGALQPLTTADDYRTVTSLPQGAGVAPTTAAAVSFTPAGNISSNNVQSALEELDSEKEPYLGLPASNGYVLASTTAGVRSWVVNGSGGGLAGTLVATRVPYATNATTLTDSAFMTFAPTTGLNVNITAGTNCLTVGSSAGNNTASGANNTLVGVSAGTALTTGSSNTFVGRSAGSTVTGGIGNVMIGASPYTGANSFSNTIIIGSSTQVAANADSAVAIGYLTNNSQPAAAEGISVGYLANASSTRSVAIGSNSATYGLRGIALGYLSYALADDSAHIATTNLFGASGEQGGSASWTINGSGASGTDSAAGALKLAGGRGTGTGLGGSIVFQTAPAGITGSAQNALVDRASIDQDGKTTLLGELQVNGIANLTNAALNINGVSYTWTGSQATGTQFLTNDGSGNLSWTSGGGGGDAYLANDQTFTGANTFQNVSGITTFQAPTQDGVIVRGGAGGSSNYYVAVEPAVLSASRVLTLPDADGTVALDADVVHITGTETVSGTKTFTGVTTFRSAFDSGIYVQGNNVNYDVINLLPVASGAAARQLTITNQALDASRTLTLPSLDGTVMVQVTLGSAPTPTTPGKVGQFGYYSGYVYYWVGASTVVRHVIESTW
jgi:hypothetical protein